LNHILRILRVSQYAIGSSVNHVMVLPENVLESRIQWFADHLGRLDTRHVLLALNTQNVSFVSRVTRDFWERLRQTPNSGEDSFEGKDRRIRVRCLCWADPDETQFWEGFWALTISKTSGTCGFEFQSRRLLAQMLRSGKSGGEIKG
jgi:hypothetical protein